MAVPNRTGGGRHRRPEDDETETDAERTERHPDLQRAIDEFVDAWPVADLDRQ